MIHLIKQTGEVDLFALGFGISLIIIVFLILVIMGFTKYYRIKIGGYVKNIREISKDVVFADKRNEELLLELNKHRKREEQNKYPSVNENREKDIGGKTE